MDIAVSILSSNYDIDETIKRVNETDAKYFHIDVMDGKFVPNVVDPYEHLSNTLKPLNVHFMVDDPFKYITYYSSLKNVDMIIFQVEIDDNIDALLDYIKSFNIKCGLAIKPDTDITEISPYLEKLDEVLVMSVEPGMGGQEFMESSLEKVETLKNIREKRNLNFLIGIDGGVNNTNFSKLKDVDIIAVGSYICKSDNYSEKVNELISLKNK